MRAGEMISYWIAQVLGAIVGAAVLYLILSGKTRLTLVVIHLVGINITGTSVNPARSIGPALIGAATKSEAVMQLWLFIMAPLIGAGAAGFLFKEGALRDTKPRP